MSDNLKVGMTIGAKDEATPVVKGVRNELDRLATARSTLGVRAEHTIQREIQKTQASYNRLARSGQLSEAELARAYNEMKKRVAALRVEMEREAEQTRNNYQRMATARETLGIRSEKMIQREIQRTEAAYNRLANAGVLSATEQNRAFSQMQSKVASLRKELQGAAYDGRGLGSKLASGAAAVWGAGQAVSPMFNRQLEFDERLTLVANRAYSDRGPDGRIEGKKELIETIRKAVQHGNGKPDDVLSGLATLITSNAFNRDEVKQLLPTVTAYATSSGGDPIQLAQVAASLKRTGIVIQEMPNALSAVVRASQLGQMDMGVLAKFLPEQLEGARNIGLTDRQALQWVLTVNETASIGAGSEDEAANNTKDLFAGLLSGHTINNAKRIKINGKGIDWVTSLTEAAGKGIGPVDAATQIFEKIVNQDKNYQKIQRQLQSEKDPTKRSRLQMQAQMIEGSLLARLWPNQQERNAVMMMIHHKKDAQRIYSGVQDEMDATPGHLAGEVDLATLQKTPAFQERQLANEKELDENDLTAPVNKALGAVASEAAKVAQEFPGLAHAAVFATDAVKAFGYALLASSAMNLLGGGSGGIGKRVLEKATGGAAKVLKGMPEWLSRYGGPALAVGVGTYDAAEIYGDNSLTDEQKDKKYTKVVGGTAGSIAGAEAGATAGSIIPGYGTVIGGLVGGIAGYFSGDWLGGKAADNLFVDKQKTPNAIMPSDALGLNPQRLDVHLYVDGQEIHAALDDRTQREAQRN
ncbi:phage tail tape measure protein [Serratia fonticola]|uniref:phage tail tape measure protein n=1 Tax=Serratia fonticola TaxID=47917 RepID=UPI00301D16F6